MYFADLEPCRYFRGDASRWEAPLLSIGWIEAPHPFTNGPTPPNLLPRLEEFILRAMETYPQHMYMGLHACSICHRPPQGLPKSNINLFIPGVRVVYAAPAGIVHYIKAHSYLPPDSFLAAVQNCPSYGSPAYFEALQTANHGAIPPLVPFDSWLDQVRSRSNAPQTCRGRNA